MKVTEELFELLFTFYWYAITIKRTPGAFRKLSILESVKYKEIHEIEKFQFEAFKKLLGNAFANSAFYQQKFKAIQLHPSDINDWNDFTKIPILKKRDIQLNMHNIISKNLSTSSLIKDATGGSTGEPLIFYHDKVTKEWFEACDIFAKSWWGIKPWGKKALLWGADRDIPKMTAKEKMKLKLERSECLNSFNMDDETMLSYANFVKVWKPQYVQGYASSLYLFAQFLKKKELSFPKSKAVRSSAETLSDYERDLIEEVFGKNIYNFYGSREIPNIALECRAHKGLHIFSPIRYVEVLSSKGDVLPPGETGKIVVTDLVNYSMPFIRYEIGDIGVIAEDRCSCGCSFRQLKKIKGRETDFITTADGKYVHGEFFTHLFYGIQGILKFQIYQRNLSSIEIRIVKNQNISRDLLDSIERKIRARIGSNVEIVNKFVDDIPIPKSGKHRFTISEIPPVF